jgi:hypothetical protein
VWYFGLQYTDEKGETAWLNLDKKLKKQDIKKEPTLQFRSDTVARSWQDFSAKQSFRSASFTVPGKLSNPEGPSLKKVDGLIEDQAFSPTYDSSWDP